MKIFDTESDGQVSGRYKCDICDDFIPINKNGRFVGYILMDMSDLAHNHICKECCDELLQRKIDITIEKIRREKIFM